MSEKKHRWQVHGGCQKILWDDGSIKHSLYWRKEMLTQGEKDILQLFLNEFITDNINTNYSLLEYRLYSMLKQIPDDWR